MLQADQFYKQGNLAKVKEIQSAVKPEFPPSEPLVANDNPENLSGAGQRHWNNAQRMIDRNLRDSTFIYLNFLVVGNKEKNIAPTDPDFIPGYFALVDAYEKTAEQEIKKGHEKKAKELNVQALGVVESLASRFPERADLLDKQIEMLLKNKKYIEASIAANQFALNYPDNPKSAEYKRDARKYEDQYIRELRIEITALSVIGTALGNSPDYGSLMVLLQGEKNAGKVFAESYKKNGSVVENERINNYVSSIGKKLAKFAGREDFEYEFVALQDDNPGAFALPGGKIFITTGMLGLIDSEAELAGILGHEISHSVLSHSFRKIANSSIASMIQSFPIINNFPVSNLLMAEASRDYEKQADILGTRLLSSSGYSADGVYNVMFKLQQIEGKSQGIQNWFRSHPVATDRVKYIGEFIDLNGYNRYAYEGVQPYREALNRK
ncbi:M48 family metalloprotease [Geminocystis herdmanii]|uniref:M48 family metalloprotease n=1 Tax=Geminocystis herdmanii TaxID=669359 RepID=UPI000345CC68|nr:M48 family metalloprotease [Geminocystis herdmanii]